MSEYRPWILNTSTLESSKNKEGEKLLLVFATQKNIFIWNLICCLNWIHWKSVIKQCLCSCRYWFDWLYKKSNRIFGKTPKCINFSSLDCDKETKIIQQIILFVINFEVPWKTKMEMDEKGGEEIMENRKDIYNLWIQYTTKVNSWLPFCVFFFLKKFVNYSSWLMWNFIWTLDCEVPNRSGIDFLWINFWSMPYRMEIGLYLFSMSMKLCMAAYQSIKMENNNNLPTANYTYCDWIYSKFMIT